MANTAQMRLPDVNKLHYYITKGNECACSASFSIASETDSDGVQAKQERQEAGMSSVCVCAVLEWKRIKMIGFVLCARAVYRFDWLSAPRSAVNDVNKIILREKALKSFYDCRKNQTTNANSTCSRMLENHGKALKLYFSHSDRKKLWWCCACAGRK